MDTNDAHILEGVTFVLPPRFTKVFEAAESQLKAFYGMSPPVNDLVSLWIACATPKAIREEFEQAVFDTTRQMGKPSLNGNIDDNF